MLAIFGGSLYLHQNGYLARGENAVAEARAAALAHARDSDIVIVGIDAESLQALNEWPWPRRHHARLLQMLRPAAPKALFVDIDFSSRSTEEDDALFERALADWAGHAGIPREPFPGAQRRGQLVDRDAAARAFRGARASWRR